MNKTLHETIIEAVSGFKKNNSSNPTKLYLTRKAYEKLFKELHDELSYESQNLKLNMFLGMRILKVAGHGENDFCIRNDFYLYQQNEIDEQF